MRIGCAQQLKENKMLSLSSESVEGFQPPCLNVTKVQDEVGSITSKDCMFTPVGSSTMSLPTWLQVLLIHTLFANLNVLPGTLRRLRIRVLLVQGDVEYPL